MHRIDTAWVPFLALLAYLVRFDYGFAIGDQDEFLPLLYHFLDPSALVTDWFTAGQAEEFGIRHPFVWMLFALSHLMPVRMSVLVVYVASWLSIAFAAQALGYTLFRDRIAAAAMVVVILVLTPQWTLGGNDLVHSMLVPSMTAWALGLWGLVVFLRRRHVAAAVLFGIATWLQPLVGLQLAGLCGLTLLGPGRSSLRFGAAYGITAGPVLLALILQQAAPASENLFYILAEFRAPHHYLFFSFPPDAFVKFGLLLGLGLGGWVFVRMRLDGEHRRFLKITSVAIAACCSVAFVCTEIIPVPLVTWLQLFKMTVLAKVLSVAVCAAAVAAHLPLREFLDTPFRFAGWSFLIVTLLWTSGMGVGFVDFSASREPSVAGVEEWARLETPSDVVFAVPPSWSGFRSGARRGIVVNFKAFPHRHGLNEEWFERLMEVAPITLPARGHPGLMDSLDAAFLRLSQNEVVHLARHFDFDFVVRSHKIAAFDEAHSVGEWTVYDMRLHPHGR